MLSPPAEGRGGHGGQAAGGEPGADGQVGGARPRAGGRNYCIATQQICVLLCPGLLLNT